MPKLARFRAVSPTPPSPASIATPILHVDMDAFFVSVELLERPDLRGKPVIVGGRPDQRGVVSAASYEARKFGIQSAMPLRTAARLCPTAVFLDTRHERYAEYSDRVASILERYSPVVEMASIDEAYLDLSGTGRLHGPPLAAAAKLHAEVRRRTGLPCSLGLASSRLVAKVASEQAKPHGLLWVPGGAEEAFLAPLPVRRIPGIGKVTEAALKSLGIETVGQLAAFSAGQLDQAFGQWGAALYRKARGQDAYEFVIDAEPKSISHNRTFGADTADRELLASTLSWLCEKAAKRLRDAGLRARTVTFTLRYAGFQTVTRARTLREPSSLDSVFLAALRSLFAANWTGEKLRLVGVALSGFTQGSGQMDLLESGRGERLERLTRAADRLRDRYGSGKVVLGSSLESGDEE
ncbi:MAG TPA: DNA polymerase IV [Patescibacteria group bacterium]|nr:DNA polymerase IV [Patescibacteria group bacterium]